MLDRGELLAVILAGGMGKRLRPLTLKVPKPLAIVNGKPFLHYLLDKVEKSGLKRCLLLTGYKQGMVRKYCGLGKKWGLELTYSNEPEPLGTGGALLNASGKIKSAALVMNGDTFCDFDLGKFLSFHRKSRAKVTICALFGSLEGRGKISASKLGKVRRFCEKRSSGKGLFNSGAYLVEPEAIALLKKKFGRRKFSLEQEGFPFLLSSGSLYVYKARARIIDIGTFSELKRAQKYRF